MGLADWLTWAFAIGCVVSAGEAVFTVLQKAAAAHTWIAWTGVAILEGPMLVCALRARDASRPGGTGNPAPYIRMTWLLAGASSAIAALAYAGVGPAAMVLRALAPIVGAFLWHGALKIEARRTGTAKQRLTRWRWTPDRILTHLGLLTAAESQTEDAEVHMRLTKVADAVIRAARATRRNTSRNTGLVGAWNSARYGWRMWRLERVYRAAERDLDLTRHSERHALLEQIIEARNAAPALMLKAGCTRAELGLGEVEQPERQVRYRTRVVFQPGAEQRVGGRQHARPGTAGTAVGTAGRPERDGAETAAGTSGGTPAGTGTRNGVAGWNGAGETQALVDAGRGMAERPGDGSGRPDREEILAELDRVYQETGKLPVRPIARQFDVSPATVQRAVDLYRDMHNLNADLPGEGRREDVDHAQDERVAV